MTFRSPALLAAVRLLPCMCCSRIGRTQPAHSNQLRFGKGRSMKASDAAIMALCTGTAAAGCHEKHDQGGVRTKLEWWAFEYLLIAKTLMQLIRRGVLTGTADVLRTLPDIETCSEALTVALVEHIEAGRLKVNCHA